MRRIPAISWFAFLLLLGAVAYVFFGFRALPFMDLPAHAGLIALRHRYPASPFDQRYIHYLPRLGPYSAFRWLGETLVSRWGALSAVRVLAALPAVATPLAVLWARRRLHGDSALGLGAMAVAMSFGLMTIFGFASYLLGLSASVVALTLWLRLIDTHEVLARASEADRAAARATHRVAWAELAAFAPVVFLCHGHAFLVCLLFSAVSLAAPPRRASRIALLSAYGPAIVVAAYAAFCVRGAASPPSWVSCTSAGAHFQGFADKLSLLVTPTLITRLGPDVVVGALVWGAVATAFARTATAAFRGNSVSDLRTRALALGLLALAAAFAALPHTVGWFGFVDGRLVLPILLFALVGIRPSDLGSRASRFFEWAGWIAGLSQVVIAISASAAFQREAAGYEEVLAEVPAGASLLNLPADPNSRVFTGHPFVHYDALAMLDRAVLPSDLWYHQGTALYPRTGNPTLRLPPDYCESDMRTVEWGAYRLNDWDYVLMRTRPEHTPDDVPAELELVTHKGGWWLWRRILPHRSWDDPSDSTHEFSPSWVFNQRPRSAP